MDAYHKTNHWLGPAALMMFLLTMVLLPFAAEHTYAGRSESPSHTLTYTPGSLVWDSATNVDTATGVAELSLFSSSYQNVASENGDNVIAPGTDGKNIIRLKNDASQPITYVAVMYRIKEADTLPVTPALADDDAFTPTASYPLPEGITDEQVVSAVTGTVDADALQDFDITWQWAYYESDARDQADTALGNKAARASADEVLAGLYIVVEEDTSSSDPNGSNIDDPSSPLPDDPEPGEPDTPAPNEPDAPETTESEPDTPTTTPPASANPDTPYTYPQAPQTGDTSHLTLYLTLMAVSGVLLLLLMFELRKEKP